MVENIPAIVKVIPDSLENATKNLTGPITSEAGTTLGDIWFLVFGNIKTAAEKRRLKYAHDLELFKKDLGEKVDSIPSERRIEPDLHIIGPALENAKYCVGKEDLRKMFSNLISSSIDTAKQYFVHPSFGEIIKQMSPLDAQNLFLFKNTQGLPLAEIRLYNSDGTYNIVESVIFLSNPDVDDIKLQSQSISALCRLGLLEISASRIEPAETYKFFYDHEIYKMYAQMGSNAFFNLTTQLQCMQVRRTPLGESFIIACL